MGAHDLYHAAKAHTNEAVLHNPRLISGAKAPGWSSSALAHIMMEVIGNKHTDALVVLHNDFQSQKSMHVFYLRNIKGQFFKQVIPKTSYAVSSELMIT
ncbi:hypothetical protein MHYP_G00057030 [Metynnis hypsauchen]